MPAGCVNWAVAGRSAQGVGKADGFDVGIAVGTVVGSELVGITDRMAVGLESYPPELLGGVPPYPPPSLGTVRDMPAVSQR